MRVFATLALFVLGIVAGPGRPAFAADVCESADEGQLRCTIRTLADCLAIRDYPYARNLFCPAAFSAAQAMVAEVAKTLGVRAPADGVFHYFQTLAEPLAPPDDQAQTTVACMNTPAPWGGRVVVGAGLPLCHLVAYVTGPGPVPGRRGHDRGNPLPDALRAFPHYFGRLFSWRGSLPLTQFRSGSAFDALVRNLGRAGRDGFLDDNPSFSPHTIYAPAAWRRDPQYHGISGGGGGGWGGEIAVLGHGATPVTLLAFGGGGGGGMTSFREDAGSKRASSALGGGGGGGMQFANGYRFRGRHYNGLGLGAGTGSDEAEVQYSYNDYQGSPKPPRPIHRYNPAVIAEYRQQLKNLASQLRARLGDGKTVIVRGGGGMGAGTEYLMPNGREYVPHALSTQAGFQFSYEFRAPRTPANAPEQATWKALHADQEDGYKQLGDFYRRANRQALEACGGDYSNYACTCPKAQAIVICLMGEALGDPKKIPAWLQESHCPDTGSAGRANGLTSYQQFLFDRRTEDPAVAGAPGCGAVLLGYFTAVNTPASEPY